MTLTHTHTHIHVHTHTHTDRRTHLTIYYYNHVDDEFNTRAIAAKRISYILILGVINYYCTIL